MICECGKRLSPVNKRGLCMPCQRNRKCQDCGTRISERSSGRCHRCANALNNASPEHKEATRRTMLAHCADPVFVEKRAESWRAWHREATKDPAFVEKLRETGRTYGKLNIVHSRSPESRAKAGHSISALRLAHIPLEQRPLYRALKLKGIPAAERERIVLEEKRVRDERAVNEVRRKMRR